MESGYYSGNEDQFNILSVRISSKFSDDLYIKMIIDKFFNYIGLRYPHVVSYVFKLQVIRPCLCTGYICNQSPNNKFFAKKFVDQLSKNRYCFCKMEKMDDDYWAIIPIIKNLTENMSFKKKNVCDLLLYFQDDDQKALFPHLHTNKDLSYLDKLTNHSEKIDLSKLVSYKRKFSVKRYAKNGKIGSDFKYTLISIIFDKPLIFMYDRCHNSDIMMKFVVGNIDYTSENGEFFDFTYKYRLNKLLLYPNPDNNLLGELDEYRDIDMWGDNKEIRIIYGFSCFENPSDCVNYDYDTKKSRIGGYETNTDPGRTRLYTMMRTIYTTFK